MLNITFLTSQALGKLEVEGNHSRSCYKFLFITHNYFKHQVRGYIRTTAKSISFIIIIMFLFTLYSEIKQLSPIPLV